MASETTVASHQTSIVHEQLEPKFKEDEKTTVQESLSSTKEGGEENSKSEDSPIPATASPETKAADDNLIEPPVEVWNSNVASELDIPKAEPDSSSLTKESAETFPCQTIPPEEVQVQEDKLIEPPTVEVEKAVDAPKLDVLMVEENVAPKEIAEEEKPMIENSKSLPETLPECGDFESKLIEPPVVEVEKIVEATTLNAQVMDEIKVGKEEPISESETPIALESTDTVKSLHEDGIISDSIEKEPPKQLATEVEGKSKQLNIVDDLEPSVEATEKPTQESELTVMKKHGYLEARSMVVEKQKLESEKVEETLGKPLEHEQEVEEKGDKLESEEKGDKLESEEKQKNDFVKYEEPLADKVEHPALLEVTASKNVDQSSPVEISDEVSVYQKGENDTKDEGTYLCSVMKNPVAEEEKKEIGEIRAITKEAEVKKGEVIEESDEYKKSSSITQDSTQTIMEESINRSVWTNEVTKNSIEDIGRDAELVQENKIAEHIGDDTSTLIETQKDEQKEKKNDEETAVKETPAQYKQPEFLLSQETAKFDATKLEEEQVEIAEKLDSNIEPPTKVDDSTKPDETPISVETIRDEQKEEKQGEVTTIVHEPIKETEQPLSEVKEEETAKNEAHEIEKEQAEKSDEGLVSSIKDDDNLKFSKDQSKEIPAKATQKQSNSIMSKVKHSLVKAKKAIIGKSHSSKAIVSKAKSDIEVI